MANLSRRRLSILGQHFFIFSFTDPPTLYFSKGGKKIDIFQIFLSDVIIFPE